MSYLPNTILTRREAAGDAYDVVRVVGISPIKQASLAEWSGAGGEHIIVAPHEEFGSNEVMPVSIAQAQYEVTEFPEVEEPAPDPRGRGRVPNISPEEAFARDAREAQSRAATKSEKAEPKKAKPAAVTS